MTTTKENDDNEIEEYYEFTRYPEDSDTGAIRIARGPFLGLIYKYLEYQFTKVDEETGSPSVEFGFDVLDIPDEMKDVEFPDEMEQSFHQLLCDILVDIVARDTAKSVRVDYDDTNREGDIDESFERRVFYENSTPVLEK
jgi:outer membrane protease